MSNAGGTGTRMRQEGDSVREVARLLHAGEARLAANMGARLLHHQPGDVALLQMTAIAMLQQGHAREALPVLRHAVRLAPGNADVHFNLAKALGAAGEMAEALAIAARPDFAARADFMRLRAELAASGHGAAGEGSDVLELYRQLAAQTPDDAEVRTNYGNALVRAGRADEGVRELAAARDLRPNSAAILANLSVGLAAAHRQAESLAAIEGALALAPGGPRYLLDRGRALNRLARHGEALAPLAEAARANPRDGATLVEIALTLVGLGEMAKAEEGLRLAITRDPAHGPGWTELATLLEQANRTDAVSALARQARQAEAPAPVRDFLDALVLRRKGDVAAALERLRRVETEGSVQSLHLAQLRGQLADRAGHAAEAWEAFGRMNSRAADHPLFHGVDRTAYRRQVREVAAFVRSTSVSDWPPLPRNAAAPPAPVFIVGFPRSGTTLLDTMLMGHSRLHVLEEQALLSRIQAEIGGIANVAALSGDEAAMLRARYFEHVAAIGGVPDGATLVDKLPLNLARAPLIHRLFPDARIVFALRHPCDAVLSCVMQNFAINPAMASFLDIDNAGATYDAVMDAWQASREAMPLCVHELRYEALVADAEGTMRDLVAFLGLDWEDAVLAHQDTAKARGLIRTPSYAAVTEPINNRAAGRWQRYRAQMAPVLPLLQPWAERFGYGDEGFA